MQRSAVRRENLCVGCVSVTRATVESPVSVTRASLTPGQLRPNVLTIYYIPYIFCIYSVHCSLYSSSSVCREIF